MKKLVLFILILMGISMHTPAQDWLTNIDEAKKQASELDLNIILVFQGSDWCAPCIKLEKEIWSSQEFQAYAKDHFVMLKADFPRKKQNALSPDQQEHNEGLAEKYNRDGYFPFVVVLDGSGKVLGESGYKKISPAEYIILLTSF